MITIFFIDRDKHLNEKCRFKYEGEYNTNPPEKKRKMIDALISRVQRKNCEDALIGLILIFQPVFKNLNKRFIGTLESQFNISSDEFMTELLFHFYHLTRHEFIRKTEKGFQANFNWFIHVKLKSKALCLLSKEKTYRKYAGVKDLDLFFTTDDEAFREESDGSTWDHRANKKDQRHEFYNQPHLLIDKRINTESTILTDISIVEHKITINAVMDLIRSYQYMDDDDFSPNAIKHYKKRLKIYELYVQGYETKKIAKMVHRSVSRVTSIIRSFKEIVKNFIREDQDANLKDENQEEEENN